MSLLLLMLYDCFRCLHFRCETLEVNWKHSLVICPFDDVKYVDATSKGGVLRPLEKQTAVTANAFWSGRRRCFRVVLYRFGYDSHAGRGGDHGCSRNIIMRLIFSRLFDVRPLLPFSWLIF